MLSVCVQDEFSRLVEKWNAQRAQAVYSALVKFLYPLMQKELHTKLLNEAKEHVLRVSAPTLPLSLCISVLLVT